MELTKFVFRGNLIAPTSYIKKIEKSKISLPASLHQEIRANYTQIKQRKGKKIKKYKLRKENIKTEKCKIENKQKKNHKFHESKCWFVETINKIKNKQINKKLFLD